MSKREPLMIGDMPLTPQWHQDALRRKKEEHPRIYARGFEHRAISESELMFPSWKLVRDKHRGMKISDILGPNKAEWFGQYGRFGGVDLSGDNRPGNAICTLAGRMFKEENRKQRHELVLVDQVFGDWTQPQLVNQLSGLFQWWDWDLLLVETNGIQGEILHWADVWEADWTSRVEGFATTAKKWDESQGLPGIEVELARGLWRIPFGEWEDHKVTCDCGWCRLDSEMSTFPASATTDGVMSLYFAWEAFRRGKKKVEYINRNFRRV